MYLQAWLVADQRRKLAAQAKKRMEGKARRGRVTYTTNVLRNNPSPVPTTSRPTIKTGRRRALASSVAPRANTSDPTARSRVRPSLSEIVPEKSDANVAERRTVETMKPCIDDMGPMVLKKVGMTVRGPITPVSRLLWG
jgi:hypothetical protein